MKAENKQGIAFLTLYIACVIVAAWSWREYRKDDWTEAVTGSIMAKSDDTVQSAKYSQRSRFLFAMQYPDRPSNTVEVELHTFVTKSVGDRYTYEQRHLASAWLFFLLFFSACFAIVPPVMCAVAAFFGWVTKDD